MTPKIVLFLRLAGQTGRNKLQGVFRYLRENRRKWDIRLPQTEKEFFAVVSEGDIGGVITSSNTLPPITRWAETTPCPVVFLDVLSPMRKTIRKVDLTVRNNDENIGQLAARHFLSIGGFASYGFVRANGNHGWDRARERGFTETLQRAGVHANVFPGTTQEELGLWLAELPKPAAVYAAWDERARDVVAACRAARIAIPRKVAVLGTDNDEIVCTLSSTEISSIAPDTEGSGYLAAKLLDQQLHNRQPGKRVVRTFYLKAKGVVDRESTQPPPPGRHLVEEVLAAIQRDHSAAVTPETLARQFHCSRRILDMRFAEFHNETIGEALRRMRLAHVEELLRNTTMRLSDIGAACGFANDNALKNLFRRTHGQTLREWRKEMSSRI